MSVIFLLAVSLMLAACGDDTATVAPSNAGGTAPTGGQARTTAASVATPAPGSTTAVAPTEATGTGGVPPVSGTATKTASGLQYIDVKVGDGPEAKAGQTVTVHYTGYLNTGKKFDSSLDKGVPFPFPLGAGRVIRGWDQGVAGMKVNGIRRLIIPPDLGYGPGGYPPVIPPNAELIFDVQLLGVK